MQPDSRQNEGMETLRRSKSRLLLPLSLLVLGLLPGLGYLYYQADPRGLVEWLVSIQSILGVIGATLLVVLLPLFVLLLLVYAPARHAITLWWQGLSKRFSFDRARARDLIGRLQQFENVPDLQELGRLYLDSGQPVLAVEPLGRAVALEPQNAEAHYWLARCLEAGNAHAPALEHARESVRIDPKIGFGEALLLAGRLALRLDLPEEAKQHAERALAVSGENLATFMLLAEAERNCGRQDDAQKALLAALEHPPANGKSDSAREAVLRRRAKSMLREGAGS